MNKEFWYTVLWFMVIGITGAAWMIRGDSPFIWISKLMLHIEAVRRVFISSIKVAMIHFFETYKDRYLAIKSEVAN